MKKTRVSVNSELLRLCKEIGRHTTNTDTVSTALNAYLIEVKIIREKEDARIERAYERIFPTALKILGTKETVERWFSTPKKVLEGLTPKEYLVIDPGVVERILGRIKDVVYS